jgi:acyl-CoA synthetase (AMP-forming)/AMP-acid ligase II
MTLVDLLDIAVQVDSDRLIATDEAGGLTLGGLWRRAAAVAGEIAGASGGPGPVAFVGVNSPAVLTALWGVVLSGRPFVPLNFRADGSLLRHLLTAAGPAVVIADARYRQQVASAAPGIPILASEAIGRGEPAGASAPSPDAVAILLFTSGSSALPKVVRIRHRHFVNYVLNSTEALSEPATAATLVASPAYHVASVANLVNSTYAGRRMVFLSAFDAPEWLRVARDERVTHAFVVPTMLYRLVSELRSGDEPPAALQTLAYGGAPAHADVVREALRRFAPTTGFVNAYGLTETSSTITLLGPEDHRAAEASSDPEIRRRLASVGRALPGVELQIDGEGVGEVLVRGAQVSGEYGAGSRLDAAGWFHTGDVGSLDTQGYLYLEGRSDDMLIRGGENVAPLEIESVFRRHPAVEDVVVTGLPDPEWGQRILAAVVASGPIDESVLLAWVRDRLPSFKVPERIVFVEELPRTETGKIIKSSIRDLLEPVAATALSPLPKSGGEDLHGR